MAEKIRRFFAKKKADAKFKLAGPGHKLNESSTTVVGPRKDKYLPQPKGEQSEASRQAAEAALARLNSQARDVPFNTSLAAIQAQVRRELESQKKESEQVAFNKHKPIETEVEASPLLAVNGMKYYQLMYHTKLLRVNTFRGIF